MSATARKEFAAVELTNRTDGSPALPTQEALLWLCGEEASSNTQFPPQSNLSSPTGGYYTIRGAETWAFTRCGVYQDRPAQADMLHVDLWWRGVNLVGDPGAYSYNSPAPWRNGLSMTRVHNCLAVDGLDQMERGPRFTWFYWTQGKAVKREPNLFIGEHYGYRKRLGVTHRRAILLENKNLWVIVDDLTGAGRHEITAQWLFPAAEKVESDGDSWLIHTPVGVCRAWFATTCGEEAQTPQIEQITGAENETSGWFSPSYLHKQPAPALIARDTCALPARRVTVFALDAATRLEPLDLMRNNLMLQD
jgi:hypothetical protein